MSDDAAERPLTRARVDWVVLRSYWWIAAAAAIGWLTWPIASIAPSTGLDPSWQIALHLAASERLTFGREILFSYGPYGFLSQPLLVTSATGIAAFIVCVVLQVALCAVLLRSALRSFPPWLAVALTYAVAVMLAATGFPYFADYLLVVVFVAAVWTIQEEVTAPTWLLPVGAALAALELLIKVNSGVACLLVVALAGWWLRPGRWRSEALVAAVFAATVVVLWVITGNSLTALPTWVREETQLVGSYTSAMAIESGTSGQYLQAGLLLLVAAAVIVAQIRRLPRWRGITIAAIAVLFAFAYGKEGFVRDDAVHVVLFLAVLAAALLGFRWTVELRWVAAVVVAAALGATAVTVGSSAFTYRPLPRARAALTEAKIVMRSSDRADTLRTSQAKARARLAVPKRLLAAIGDHTVDVEPFETSAAWAYGLRWRPQRLIQSYVATDHALDLYNAHGLRVHGPSRILLERHPQTLDDKNTAFLAPESALVMLCRYRALRKTEAWTLLGRTAERCGPERQLDSMSAAAGQPVSIPSGTPGDIVYARIHASPTLKQRLAALVFKPVHYPQLRVDGQTYRLVTDTARGPLVLRMPGGSGASRLALTGVASPYRIDFFAVSLG